ncbi:glycosyltransferase family 2 protein [Pedobacter sp. PWIIR3]
MIFSIITPVLNGEEFIECCIQSVQSQDYPHIEHVIVDGGSSDMTISKIENFNFRNIRLHSTPKLGLYEAINEGILRANGDVIGVLNADDFLTQDKVISSMASYFLNGYDAVYGCLNVVKRKDGRTVCRKWVSSNLTYRKLKTGWMPPHPTLYIRRTLFNQSGLYTTKYRIAGDYEFILRLFLTVEIKTFFVNSVLVNMRAGGISNGSYKKQIDVLKQDYAIMKAMEIKWPIVIVLLKRIRKINQIL